MPQPIRLKDHERDARQVRRRVFVGGAVVLALTLPHPLVRILVGEQIYRAWTVLSGHPYHK